MFLDWLYTCATVPSSGLLQRHSSQYHHINKVKHEHLSVWRTACNLHLYSLWLPREPLRKWRWHRVHWGLAHQRFLHPQLGEPGGKWWSMHDCTHCLLHSPHYELMVSMPRREIPFRLLYYTVISQKYRNFKLLCRPEILHNGCCF